MTLSVFVHSAWLAFFAFAVYLVVILASLNAFTVRSPIRMMVLWVLPIFALGPTAAVAANIEMDIVEYAAIFGAAVMGLFFLFAALYKSISIRMMRELLHSPGLTLPREQIFREYVVGESYRGRVSLLVQEDFLKRDADGSLQPTGRGRLASGIMQILQRIYAIRDSG